jgi:hypothetical protein
MSTIHRTPEHAHVPARRRPAIAARVGGITALASIFLLALPGSSPAATSVGLGTAGSYAVLAGAGVTNTGPTVINGDLGSSPTPAITGFGGAPGGTVNGTIHSADADAASAQNDLTTAYNDAVGQGPPNMVATELGGSTLTPGVYEAASGTFGITGTLTLNAQGNPDAVFIFDAATTLTTATASRVSMINGAQACNVFWKVGSSATLGTDSAFAGNILALQSISLNDGVTVQGRLLARNGAVTLINDTVTRAGCAAGPGDGDGDGPGDGDGDGNGDGDGPGDGGGDGPGDGPGGNGNGNPGPRGGPTVHIVHGSPDCAGHGFRVKFNIKSRSGLRRADVYLNGHLVKHSTRKQFSVWIKNRDIRSGRNTIRLVAVDVNGRRDTQTRSFPRCEEASLPDFTGRTAAGR